MESTKGAPWLVTSSCDDRYLWPWACSLFTAVINAESPFRVLLANVNDFLSSEGQKIVRDLFQILEVEGDVVNVSLQVGDVRKHDWNATVYARIGLMDTIEERFMWLDSDTILCRGWQKIFGFGEMLMVNPSIVACGVIDRPMTLDQLKSSGTNSAFQVSKGNYFNTGILLVDPSRWRDEGMNERWGELIESELERGFEYPDQDVLNFLLAGKIGFLPKGYNHIVSEPTIGTESILHYAGFPKPWRLSERGRAFFVATEVLNHDRPKEQISGGGQSWELFPRYWETERALIAALRSKGGQTLADKLINLRDAHLMTPNFQERIKLLALRIFSRKLLPQF